MRGWGAASGADLHNLDVSDSSAACSSVVVMFATPSANALRSKHFLKLKLQCWCFLAQADHSGQLIGGDVGQFLRFELVHSAAVHAAIAEQRFPIYRVESLPQWAQRRRVAGKFLRQQWLRVEAQIDVRGCRFAVVEQEAERSPHDNTACTEGNNIEDKYRRAGTDNRRRCHSCTDLAR